MVRSIDPTDRWVFWIWYAALVGFTAVMIVTYYEDQHKIHKFEENLPETWNDAAWECSYPVSGTNVQLRFNGAVIQQSDSAKQRSAFSPELRSPCHHCRPEDGNRFDGHEFLVPGYANATGGVSTGLLALRSGIITLGGFYNNADLADVQASRCTSVNPGAHYLLWDDAGSELHICYCRLGTEYCGDPMLTDGDSALNCVGGSTVTANDCSSCSPGDQLC